jgi:hypothetical protein
MCSVNSQNHSHPFLAAEVVLHSHSKRQGHANHRALLNDRSGLVAGFGLGISRRRGQQRVGTFVIGASIFMRESLGRYDIWGPSDGRERTQTRRSDTTGGASRTVDPHDTRPGARREDDLGPQAAAFPVPIICR